MRIDPPVEGFDPARPHGQVKVTPERNIEYALTARGLFGSSTRLLTIRVAVFGSEDDAKALVAQLAARKMSASIVPVNTTGGVKLFTVPYQRPVPGEIAVQQLRVPDRVKIGEPFEVRAEIYASRKAQAKALLYQGEALNGLEGAKTLALSPGANEVTWKSVVRVGGEVTYRLELEPASADATIDSASPCSRAFSTSRTCPLPRWRRGAGSSTTPHSRSRPGRPAYGW